MELDASGWSLSPGTEHLAKLATSYPEYFGRTILTTNFDPLLEVAIQRSGGHYFRTNLHADGNLSTEGMGCHIIHLHGYWRGSDTLHTGRQLGQPRPRLKASLASLLRNKLIVVTAYGGWDDTFTEALMDVVSDETAYPEIIWTFYNPDLTKQESLLQRIEPGINRGRVDLYVGINCHAFLQKLHQTWDTANAERPLSAPTPSNPVRISGVLREQVLVRTTPQIVLQGDDEDNPPFVEVCVGRESELATLRSTNANIIFLTGLGGQGKSTLAARYFADSQSDKRFSVYVWRDCKEESERFENQLASVIEKLTNGAISGEDLAKQNAESTAELLISLIEDTKVLFVFDNVDHYVDLETLRLAGSPDIFVKALLLSGCDSKVVFTCRPSVSYSHPLALSRHLEGLSLEATHRLFAHRGATPGAAEIADAHEVTEGHSFWLDLLAVQIVKRAPDVRLTTLVNEIRYGGGPLPEKTLRSIWETLKDREQMVLRAMAETVKPETEAMIGEYLATQINYNKFLKTLRSLRALNLVVVKRRPGMPDVLELHPMVRQFVWRNFTMKERFSFLNAIIQVYNRFIGRHKSQLTERPSLSLLQYWSQNAELDIKAGKFSDACEILSEVADAFTTSAYPREFIRCVRLLLAAADWTSEHGKLQRFEKVFNSYIHTLEFLGERAEADTFLERYEQTLAAKDARYINYCEMRCFSYWIRGDFRSAVEWGEKGDNLKSSTGVDTQFDVAYTLALARREAGEPELALPIFLRGRNLSEVLDRDELAEDRGGAHYGNIGRCLHLMGQIDSALSCYQKSALLIEKDSQREHVLNQGYVRAWIGELLLARQQLRLAEVFCRAAYLKWEHIFPERALKTLIISQQIRSQIASALPIDDSNVEDICIDWILGRNIDSEFQ